MNATTTTRALLLVTALAAGAQTAIQTTTLPAPTPKPHKPKPAKSDAPTYNTNLIVLDPAHGGPDNGATLGEKSLEKDATMAFAALLKPRLEAKGFTVVLTHALATDDTPTDARVELANRNRPVACLLLHASNGGHGVHLYTSALTPNHPSLTPDDSKEILPWDTAQASVLPQSLRLSSDLAAALNGIRIPLVVGQASIKPIDSLSCPAVALELAPLPGVDSSAQTPASDPAYQARVADSVAQALVFWRGHVVSITSAAAAAREMATPTPEAPKPAPKPKPKPVAPPVKIPTEEPLAPDVPAPKRPAPIVRPAPEAAPPPPPNTSGGSR